MRCSVVVISLLALMCGALADEPHDTNESKLYIDHVTDGLDTMHDYVSHKVKVFSSNVDEELTSFTTSDDSNESASQKKKHDDNNASASMSDYVSNFFRDETFLDSNNRSYLRIRLGYEWNQKENNELQLRVNFNLNLPHTQDSLKLFIGEEIDEDIERIDSTPDKERPSVGVRYFAPEFLDRLKTDVSVGVSGLDPNARLYLRYNMDFYDWRIYPTQEFRYGSEDYMTVWGYEEQTRLYFDRKISKLEMMRFLLFRNSESFKEGQRYGMSVSYFNTLNKRHVGFNTYAAISGDSRYFENHPDYIPKGHEHTGIDSYRLGVVWKQGLYKDWLFYDIEPLVEWQRKYYYDENYIVRFNLEFWFGHI